jgi:phage/plasmid-associated DNA primase
VDPLILRFVGECCKTGDERSATAKDLYIAYLRWCDENDNLTLRQRDFGMNLSGMGFLRQRRAGGRHWWFGIGMTPKNEWSNEDL